MEGRTFHDVSVLWLIALTPQWFTHRGCAPVGCVLVYPMAVRQALRILIAINGLWANQMILMLH
jgi:hypothetical protein